MFRGSSISKFDVALGAEAWEIVIRALAATPGDDAARVLAEIKQQYDAQQAPTYLVPPTFETTDLGA
jgi:hypothetical protein